MQRLQKQILASETLQVKELRPQRETLRYTREAEKIKEYGKGEEPLNPESG